jgi:hypothetical protein
LVQSSLRLRLLTAHKILIAAALVLALLLTARSAFLFFARQSRADAPFAAASFALAVTLGWYLRKLLGR